MAMHGDVDNSEVRLFSIRFRQASVRNREDVKKHMNRTLLKIEYDVKRNFTPNGPSKPGEPPAVDTGHLRRNITHEIDSDPTTDTGRTGTRVEYGRYLEIGTRGKGGKRKLEPRPYLTPALQQRADYFRDGLAKIIARNIGMR